MISIRLCRRGRVHAITEGSELLRQTLCDRDADGAVVVDEDVNCKRCLRRMS